MVTQGSRMVGALINHSGISENTVNDFAIPPDS
jgi:hypothetical protein